ncbi:major facilitator superfamily domain-containing protein [Rhexocercosporidium sp. MPI-PUGE-AT-0058]|nr:major facilitator superfamily domain-containing protein [Rhexocercosporidium sp. MPI-PUGE-AT-0058]
MEIDPKQTFEHVEGSPDLEPENEKGLGRVENYDLEWVAAQKRYPRKLDLTILPMISTLYFFEYLDRGNIAFSVCLLQISTFNVSALYVCRVFLGAFEGLFGTGIVYYVSLWYHRSEMGVRIFWFLGSTTIAGAFGGLIAYGVGHINSHIQHWKLLFLIEGLPGFVLGLILIAEARYHSEAFDKAGKIQKKHVIMTLTDWRLYAQAAIYIPTAALLASISGFLPTIISNLGYTEPTKANLMTVPPCACAFVLIYLVSWNSDRMKERGIHLTCLMIVAAIAYALLATLDQSHLGSKYACMCIAVACVYATYPPSHAWAANNFGNETKRAIGMGLYTALGNCGSIAGTWLYPAQDAPRFQNGHWVAMGLALATACLSLGNSLSLGCINRDRDRKFGKIEEGEVVDVTEEADRSPKFRFIT